jgi:transposase-like protein
MGAYIGQIRRTHSAEFKSKVALAAIRGEQALSNLAREYQVHPHQITAWKQLAPAVLPAVQ